MKIFILTLFYVLSSLITHSENLSNRENLLNDNWRFKNGGTVGAHSPDYDDSHWRTVNLPHDWSIEDLPGTNSPFNKDAAGQESTGFTAGGTGWYRKTFTVSQLQAGKRFIIQFDGIYMYSEVWINGHRLGIHPYGYTGFWFDITDRILPGETNLLAVKVMNEGHNTRWYSGSGIYRHVWLKIVEPVHVAQWGTFVTTPEISPEKAVVNIKTNIENHNTNPGNVNLVTIIRDENGKEIARKETSSQIAGGENFEFDQDVTVLSPRLWSPASPALYTAVSNLVVDGKYSDSLTTSFGIRSIAFDPEKGFSINGQPLLLKGGNVHHDNGPLGARAFDRTEERRVELLKASGYNAIRTSHNPPSSAFLKACDQLGMLVIDEIFDAWEDPKTPFDYHLYFSKHWKKDLASMILRDRNHPSVIMWSIGNEIPNAENERVIEMADKLARYSRQLDPTRPVTAGVHRMSESMDPFIDRALDVAGYNYAPERYVSDHARRPNRIMYGSESSALFAFEYWMGALDHSWVIGDFVWTSFDYIGEASIGWRGFWSDENIFPWTLAFCGDIDICGWKRPQSYYRDALWGDEKSISIFVKPPQPSFPLNENKELWSNWHWHDVVADWNWAGHEGQLFEVQVYSSYDQVELLYNGKSLGRKPTNRSTEFMAKWDIPYQAGTLTAIGYIGRRKIAETILATTGEAEIIKLLPDRSAIKADGQDLSYITVELTDANGLRNPKTENLLHFEIEGPGEIIAVGNANPVSLESNSLPKRKAWQGRALVIVKAGNDAGEIRLKASSEGLIKDEIIINCQ